jgi:peptidoglycan-associated lipoprotein
MKRLAAVLLLLTVILVSGCSKHKKQTPPALADAGSMEDLGTPSHDYATNRAPAGSGADKWDDSTASDRALTHRPYSGDWVPDSNLQTVYFDTDSAQLGDTTRRALKANADYLRTKAGTRVLVEGHCDERGTEEYNQALGEKRALSVRDYLINLGISDSRIDVISYGEQRPAVEGSGESVWRKNRRAEFKVAS